MTEQLDRKDLKIQALLEKISNMTAQYEDQVANLRVELTMVSQELAQLQATKAEDESPELEEAEPEAPTPKKSANRKN